MTSPSSVVLLEVAAVSKTFGDQRALDAVSVSVGRGQIHALVGENGSGKSTLIKILAGYYTPDPGSRVRVEGQELAVGSPSESHRLGLRFVHQNLGLIGELSAADNLGMVAGFATGALGRVKRAGQRARTAALVARVGIRLDVDLPVSRLRPVERSAVAIARALDDSLGELKLLVLDEPTAALPPTEVAALFRVVKDLAARGVSVLYVSHRLDEVLSLADVVSVLRDGRFKGTYPVGDLDRERIVAHILGTTLAAGTEVRPATPRLPGGPVLQVRGLTTRYLKDIAFDLAPGEIVGVAGLDGSGRDELAAALGGAIDARGQVIDADGTRLGGLTARNARRHGIALVLPNWHPASAVREFDVRENISLAALRSFSTGGIVRRDAERAGVLGWMAGVDIRPRDPHKVYALLSGGNQQKAIVARWLATAPKVLVLDDPTSGVDVGARAQIYDLLREQAARGVAVLLCSSDLEDLVTVSDRVLCLMGGRTIAEVRGADISESRLLAAITRARPGESDDTRARPWESDDPAARPAGGPPSRPADPDDPVTEEGGS